MSVCDWCRTDEPVNGVSPHGDVLVLCDECGSDYDGGVCA